ncbi:phospholipase [Bacillus salipaludis]|uniref:Phospholipase n=1 Tax=Bacillus salipaludis TaxID=2547811 RepID=A0A4V3ATG6_9BACI|nr:phospholipase [Bacillus salipaludis]
MVQGRKKRKSLFPICIFPEYRWCGPGCSGPGAPINDVDYCCYRHDTCLDYGISPCQCDYEFMECLRYKRNPHTQKGRNANLMYEFMKMKTSLTCGGDRRYR